MEHTYDNSRDKTLLLLAVFEVENKEARLEILTY